MKTIRITLSLILTLSALAVLPQSANAQAEENGIKQRILQRVGAVDELKIKALLGENNKGLLEQRAMLAPAQTKVMNEENADRKALYAILAKRLGLSVTVVGQGRAESIRKKSAPKLWIQEPSGKWLQK
ncbi:MAG: DUF1318 domain-containing protein [Opitutales bacterium]|jgi:uncharacterized protein|nr:DUF1318 domain-containing protein [Opitutales bacterium]MBT6767544.1 DUF1318 domain-containing protein [Opitutales bacterium]